jgi:hypothetical protein
MPRPPILPIPDRAALFAGGQTPQAWLNAGAYPENEQRMREALARLALPAAALERAAGLARGVRVLAVAEAWCGDVVRHTPVLLKLVEASAGKVQVRFITMGQAPEYFVRFLTNGGEAVPKFVFHSEDMVEVGHWGPMSSTPRLLIAQGKACNNVAAARQRVGAFYEADQARESSAELLALMELAAFGGF